MEIYDKFAALMGASISISLGIKYHLKEDRARSTRNTVIAKVVGIDFKLMFD